MRREKILTSVRHSWHRFSLLLVCCTFLTACGGGGGNGGSSNDSAVVAPPVVPPVTPPVTTPVTPPVTTPVTPPVTTPVTPPVTTPVTPPVTTPVTPPVTTPVTPPTPLILVNVSPGTGEKVVDTSVKAVATFAEGLNPGSVTEHSVSIVGPRGRVEASRAVTDGVLTIAPKLPLDFLAKFEFRLENTLTSAKGGSFGGSSSAFTTRDGDWQRQRWVASYSPRNALYSQVAVNDAGDTAVAWVQADGIQYTIWGNRFDARTKTWETAYRLDTTTVDALYPSVSIDAAGNIVTTWLQNDGSRGSIVARTFSAGSQSWSNPKLIATDNTFPYSMGAPKVDIDQRGIAMVAWTQAAGLFVCESSGDVVANTWGNPKNIAAEGPTIVDLRLARNPLGDAILSMKRGEDIYALLYSAAKGEWTTQTQISQVGNNMPQPTFDAAGNLVGVQVVPSLDRKGNAYVVWTQFDGRRGNTWVNRFDASKNAWGVASLLDPAANTETYHPSVAALPLGGAMAVWRKYDGRRFNIWAKQYSAVADAWSTPVRLDSAPSSALYPSVATDASGNAVAAWPQNDGSRVTIWASRYNNITGAWGNASHIELAAGDDPAGAQGESLGPQLSVGSTGRAAVAWVRSSGNAVLPFLVAAVLFN